MAKVARSSVEWIRVKAGAGGWQADGMRGDGTCRVALKWLCASSAALASSAFAFAALASAASAVAAIVSAKQPTARSSA